MGVARLVCLGVFLIAVAVGSMPKHSKYDEQTTVSENTSKPSCNHCQKAVSKSTFYERHQDGVCLKHAARQRGAAVSGAGRPYVNPQSPLVVVASPPPPAVTHGPSLGGPNATSTYLQ